MAAAPPAAPVPVAFLQTLKTTANVSAACVAGVNQILQDKLLARQAEFFSGRVGEGLNLLLPPVLKDLAFAKDKRKGLGDFVYEVPLWSLGDPDSCGYIGLHYCTIDAVPVFAKWGVCVPSSCGLQDVMTAIFPPATKKLAEHIKGRCGPVIADKSLFIQDGRLSTGAWMTLSLLALLLLAVALSTVIDKYGKEWRDDVSLLHNERFLRIIHCFSLRRNYERLMAPPRAGPFACLDGIRTLSMLMIIFGHTMFFTMNTVGVTNPRESLGFYGRGFLATGWGLIAENCMAGVDTFLALAGFLAVLLFLKELKKRLKTTNGGIHRSALISKMAVFSYIRRYLRLTPAYAVILAVFTTLAPLMSSAPPSPTDLITQTRQCEVKWWQNLLYVNNILSTPYTMCYNPSWFLAVVQQLFLIVPWISALAYYHPKAAVTLCILACVGSYIYSFEKGKRGGWRINAIDRPGFPNFFTQFYARPLTRMPTFLIGAMAAILYTHYGEQFKAYVTRGRSQLKAWGIITVGLVILALQVFGAYRELAFTPGKWSQTTSSLYISLCWSAWILGLSLICAVLSTGHGGIIKWFLELPFWAVTSRLTYSTYLVHPMVILTVISSRGGSPFHFSLLNLFNEFIGFCAMSGLSAVIFYFLVECPFAEVDKVIFSRHYVNKENDDVGLEKTTGRGGSGGTLSATIAVETPSVDTNDVIVPVSEVTEKGVAMPVSTSGQ